MSKLKVLFVSTYPPRACGIATFTQDLVTELEKTDQLESGIAAISDADYSYPKEVLFTIDQQNPEDYSKLAEKINQSGFDLVMIEHEYGIYGGNCGEYLLLLANNLKIPYFITLHTVLPNPKLKQKEILKSLSENASKVITMAANTVEILTKTYGILHHKIAVIPHGVPNFPIESRETLKKKAGFSGRFIISTFGLISPGKGLEYGIKAVATAAQKHPDILYLILGQTHPVIKRRDGEKYRESLIELVNEHHISNNVVFINRYLTKKEIIQYLQLSDVYMTPYLGKDQAVSGTLAYAAGYGRVIISTPYLYAREMLADGRGLLAQFKSAASLSKQILKVMEHPKLQFEMERKTAELSGKMRWNCVAENYLTVFRKTVNQKRRTLYHHENPNRRPSYF